MMPPIVECTCVQRGMRHGIHADGCAKTRLKGYCTRDYACNN